MIIREGKKEDLQRALELIQELADFENASDEVALTVDMMEQDAFGKSPVFNLFVAEVKSQIVGIALYYYRYSTWKGKTMFLEDLVITPSERGKGYGKALFEAVIKRAKKNNCQRMSWQVLDWNDPAIKFYEKYNAHFDKGWVNCDLYKEQLDNFE